MPTPTPTETPAPEGTVVRLATPTGVSVGDEFALEVTISPVEEFDATNYDVVFDPDLVEVVEMQDGKLRVSAGAIGSTEVPVDATNEVEPGRLRIVQNVPGTDGVNGSGTLASIRLRAVANGTTKVLLKNGVLSSAQAEEIPAEWEATSITIGG